VVPCQNSGIELIAHDGRAALKKRVRKPRQLTYRSISLFVECTIDKSGKIAKLGLRD
jgi:hypothetical protein